MKHQAERVVELVEVMEVGKVVMGVMWAVAAGLAIVLLEVVVLLLAASVVLLAVVVDLACGGFQQ